MVRGGRGRFGLVVGLGSVALLAALVGLGTHRWWSGPAPRGGEPAGGAARAGGAAAAALPPAGEPLARAGDPEQAVASSRAAIGWPDVAAAAAGASGAAAVIEAACARYLEAVARAGTPEGKAARQQVFEQAVAELVALGPRAIPELLAQLEANGDAHARLVLLTAIARMGGEAGIEGTLQALRQLDDRTSETVFLQRLVRGGRPEELAVAEAVLVRAGDPADRALVLAEIGRGRQERLAPLLLEVARRDGDERLRHQALQVAERMGRPLDAAALVEIAGADPSPAVRERAARQLASAHPQEFLAAARTLLVAERDPAVAQRVLQLVGERREPEAGELLRELASRGPSAELRTQARQLLRLWELGAARGGR
ncbi:MAG: hypothetical protein KatS3mg102_1674 [Planctomycetota bacterium]|nr:MAG: hypothetical protein KatS3mg102_1674 [Planctomycetota bacterium]